MKCQYCGAPLPEDAAFCHCCAKSQITKKAMLPPEKQPPRLRPAAAAAVCAGILLVSGFAVRHALTAPAPTEAPETEAPASDSSVGQEIANYAVQFVGNPYVYGGTSLTNGADCSGFTQSVMANFGIYIARTAADQSYGGTSVSISDIQPGDLLFYSDGGGISHVALYIGGGQIVHAATESQGIIISSYNYDSPVCAARYW